MLINELCKTCSLTKKAVEYYVEQGLVRPSVQENGYRDFSEEDAVFLKRVSLLRGLGLSVADIKTVLSGRTFSVLNDISRKKMQQEAFLSEKQKLLQELADSRDWEQAQEKWEQLSRKQSVLERLLNVFPGYYGRYVCFHFAPYLEEPVLTKEQQEAYDTVISFLDHAEFQIPADLQEYVDEIAVDYDEAFAENVSAGMKEALQDIEKYLTDHRETIEEYRAFKQSGEYKSTPLYRFEKSLRQFTETSGYNDVFIPAMCRLSNSYREYHEMLQKADERLEDYGWA